MILKAIPQKKKDEFDLIDDIRVISDSQFDFGSYFHIHLFPVLSAQFNKTYHSKFEKVNLFNFTCSCQQFKDNSKLYQERDVRKACKHIYYKATQSWLKDFIPEITLLLLKVAVFNSYKYLYKVNIYKKDVYFIINQESAWIKVITQNSMAIFTEYTYHTIQKRWGYSSIPDNDVFIIDQIYKIIKYQFPVEHPYKIFSEVENL